jgi:hypothetical protein
MNIPDFATFEASALARGFDEVAERVWPANIEAPTHTHPFSVDALVVQGEMWLTSHGSTRHLVAGDSFQLGLAVEHAERYGPEGATYWAARRKAPATA